MDSNYLFGVGILVFLLGSFYVYIRFFKAETKKEMIADNSKQMQLQAYERLTLLTERIALPNLISRLNVPDVSAREMQMILVHGIREEYEYNISQQIYVSSDAWTSIKNLKDQNILLVNQIAQIMPETATGMELNKVIIEFLMNDRKGTLHELVSEVLSYEAKKLLAP